MDYLSIETLEKLYALKEKGIITQAEYDAKKAEILGNLNAPAWQNSAQESAVNGETADDSTQTQTEGIKKDFTPINPLFSGAGHPKYILGMRENSYCALMHISLLFGIVLPGLGLLAPLILWVIGKEESRTVRKHARVIFNWVISFIIYMACSLLLMFVLVGFVTIVAVLLMHLILPIIGAIRASEGKLQPYALSIRFMDPENF